MFKRIEIEHANINDDDLNKTKYECLRVISTYITHMEFGDYKDHYSTHTEKFEFFKDITSQIKGEFIWLSDKFPNEYKAYSERWNNIYKNLKQMTIIDRVK